MQVLCPSCSGPLPLNQGAGTVCLRCRRPVELRLFPALAGRPPPLALPDPPGEGEAACFYNPERKATCSCTHCGVLISEMWAAQWGEGQVCLKCLDHLRAEVKDGRFESKRTLWGRVVLTLAILPMTMFCWPTVFITAPAALLLGLWHWKSPTSIKSKSKLGMVVGMILALLQIVGLGLYFGGVIWSR
jgi:hypothetical protein